MIILLLSAPPAMARWVKRLDVSKMDDMTRLTLQLEAITTHKDRHGRAHRPTLFMTCSSGRLRHMYFDSGGVLGSAFTRLRFDDAPPDEDPGSYSSDYRAIFWNYDAVWALRTLTAKRLRVEFSYHGGAIQVAEFRLAGLEKYAADLKQHCGPQF